MKKVITTVGTSIFTNCLKQREDIRPHFDALENASASNWNSYQNRIEMLRSVVSEWARDNLQASAELKSTKKIQAYYNEPLDVFLIATDTVLCRLAAEIIRDLLVSAGNDFTVFFNPQIDVITGLQVTDKRSLISEGLCRLVDRINQIAGGDLDTEGYYRGIVFNITGGFKAVIPYITIMAQINGCEMAYIYEDTDTLITIPKVPIKIDFDLFQELASEINMLRQGIDRYRSMRNERFIRLEEHGMVEMSGDVAMLSPLGTIFHNRYQNRFFTFYATEEVSTKIETNTELKRILLTKFSNPELRQAKTELKGINHKKYIYDDGNNPYRIAYLIINGELYVYRIFDDEQEQQKYLMADERLDVEIIRKQSKQKQMEKTNVP